MLHLANNRPEGRLLVLAVRARRTDEESKELRRLVDELSIETARAIAKRNQVEALVGTTLRDVVGSEALPRSWETMVEENGRRVQDLVDLAAKVTASLRARGCPCVAIEGGGVMLGSKLPFEAYCSSDIDLLVPAGRLDEVDAVTKDLGGVKAERGPRTLRTKFKWERQTATPLWLEACDRPFDRNWVALPCADRWHDWLGRRGPSTRASGAEVLDASDAVVLVAMHTSLHAFVLPPGIRLHVDVDRLATDNVIDWDRVVTEAQALGAPTRVFASLALARSLMGTRVPLEVLEALTPSARRRHALHRLLEDEGIVNDGPKLRGVRRAALDMLTDDR
ncbi:MAG: nucleotidyltransferase family protein, partial [Polyangiaceae bacterium]